MSVLDEFGLPPRVAADRETQAGSRPPPLDHIEAQVTSLATAADGRLVFTLDNGQVWRQLGQERDVLANAGDNVRISRGALGSFFIKLPSHSGCKVTRLR